MAVVSVTAQNIRLDDAESNTDWGNIGGGQGGALETDFKYQNANCFARKGGAAQRGIFLSDNVDSDLSGAGTHETVMFKFICTTPGLLDLLSVPGMRLSIGSGSIASTPSTDFHSYDVQGSDTYPVDKSWLVLPIDPNVSSHRSGTTGSPSLTVVDYYALEYDQTGTSKSPNQALDAVDIGAGLTLVGGDGADPDGVWQDFSDADWGTSANRYGYVREIDGAAGFFLVFGQMIIGTATATVFNDSDATVIFPDGLFAAGFSGITVDLQNATTDVDFVDSNFFGKGRKDTKRFFETTEILQTGGGQVTDSTDVIDFSDAMDWKDGDAVLYSREGGTENIGLADATEFFVNVITDTQVSMHTTKANALADTSRIALTGSTAANGENHSFIYQPDTRPDLTVTGTSGDFDTDGCVFDAWRNFILTSAATLVGGSILNSGNIAIDTATLDGLDIFGQTTTEGVALIDPATTLANIKNCNVTVGAEGHLARVTATGTYAFDGNTLTGFWAPAVNGWKFDTITGVDAATEVITTDAAHGFTSGDAVFYNDEGGTDTVGLTDLQKYYVNVISTTTLSLHRSRHNALADVNRINLSDGSTGESHSLYSGKAAIFNDSGGLVTINVTGGGSTPSIRNGGSASTAVNNAVNLTVTVKDAGGVAIQNAQVAIFDSGDVQLMNEDTNASGVATESFDFGTPEAITIRVRKSSQGTTRYVTRDATGTIESTGFTLDVTLLVDANAPHQTTIDSYASSNQDAAQVLNDTKKFVGQSFTGDGDPLTRAELFIKRTNALTGIYRFHVYAHTGTFGSTGTPTGSPLASSRECQASDLTTSYQLIGIVFNKPFTPLAATNYFLVIEYQDGTSTNTLDVGVDSSSPTHGGNVAHSNDGSSWTPVAGEDGVFSAQGTP